MKKYSIQFLIIFFTGLPFLCNAQTNKDSAIILFKNLIDKYNHTDYLSYRLEYTYREDSNPKVVLDSIRGYVMMSKENYHLVLGNTETIHNDKYNIILFKEDSLMYISKSSVGSINPVSILDSMFTKIKGIEILLTDKKRAQLITLNFPDGMDYKSAEYFIDGKTGYLLRIRYKVNAIQMLNPADRSNAANTLLANKWGIVQCLYSKHETGKFTDNEFDDKKYFIKEASEFKPTDAYKKYKIFLASPGL
jgi:hypothetical protein